MNNMTSITAGMFNQAISYEMSITQAVQMLEGCADFRKLSDKLKVFARDRDLRAMLVDGLVRHHKDASIESIDRKVRNWLADRQSTISKRDAIELCFIYGLSVEDADFFLTMIAEEGFHWRDPDEIVYIYALGHDMGFLDAQDLHGRIMAQIHVGEDVLSPSEDSFTAIIREEVKRIHSVEELTDYMHRAQTRLGKKHNTAYRLFLQMLKKLEVTDIEDGLTKESSYTAIDIARDYLYQPPIPKSTGKKVEKGEVVLSAMQRNVKANWPDEYGLSRMKNRATDVTRKVMILLFLATYEMPEFGDDDDYDLDLEDEQTPDEVFQDFYQKMDDMLEYCGFSRLDARIPFDWMTLYCMCTEDIFFLDQRLETFLSTLFHTGNEMQE